MNVDAVNADPCWGGWLKVRPARGGGTVPNPSDDRSSMARAYQWASRIMVVAMEMVLPGLGGYWLDKHIGTVILFTLVGFGFGTTSAVVHLIQMTRADSKRNQDGLDG